jgi:very-short-patch-repair endonuclease
LNTLLLGLGIGMVMLIAVLLYGFLSRASARWPYRKADHLLTPAERSFFGVLGQAIDSDLYIFAKVRLSDLLWLPQRTRDRQAYLNRIQSKHVDFVLCDSATTEPRLLIELDDSSHQRARRRSRDAFLDEAVRRAGLPILRVPAKRSYAPAELRQLISSLLAGNGDATGPTGIDGKKAE